MAASIEEFKTLLPAFATGYTDNDIAKWLVQAALRFKLELFHGQADNACYYFTAHMLTVFPTAATPGGSSGTVRGPVTAESVGDVSRSYGSAGMDASRVPVGLQPFLSTTYGQMLLSIIMSRSAARGGVVRTGSSAPASADTTNEVV